MKPNTKLLLERELSWLAKLKAELKNYTLSPVQRSLIRDQIETTEAEVERLKDSSCH